MDNKTNKFLEKVVPDEFLRKLCYNNIMSKKQIKIKLNKFISQLPQVEKIRKVSLFGSHQSGDAGSGSDVDLLVEFQKPVGYFELVRLQSALEKKMKKKIDLVTPGALSKYFRVEVMKRAEMVYEKR